LHHTPGAKLWQRNYYEHIIRLPVRRTQTGDERELKRLREYIRHNPGQWENDRDNPEL